MFIKKMMPPLVVSVEKVWERAEHNAFTDLCFHAGKFYLLFREADSHQNGGNGAIRILTSPDGHVWESKALLEMEGVDLRDPKLTLMPDGRFHLLAGGSVWDSEGSFQSLGSFVAIGDASLNFTPFQKILSPGQWLWRLTWYKGVGYGVAYDINDEDWTAALYKTEEGLHFSKIVTFDVEGDPSEATVRFTPEGEMRVLLRRSLNWNTHALWGISQYPYKEWEWLDTGFAMGGPDFIILPDGKEWLSGRLLYATPYALVAKTALYSKEQRVFRREIILPSFGDTSYPGLIFHDNYLWMSYYSSHEDNKSAIYMAKILLGPHK